MNTIPAPLKRPQFVVRDGVARPKDGPITEDALKSVSGMNDAAAANDLVGYVNSLVSQTRFQVMQTKYPVQESAAMLSNASLGLLADLEPSNALESILASHIMAVNELLRTSSKRLLRADVQTADPNELKQYLSLNRLMLKQLEAMKKLKNKEQKIVVQHLNINEGGQAVVGVVGKGGV